MRTVKFEWLINMKSPRNESGAGCVKGDFHARFCGKVEVRFPCLTRLTAVSYKTPLKTKVMKHAVITLTLLLAFTASAYAQKGEEKQVRRSFDNYRSAILNDKGDEAAKFVDSRTLKYYGDMLELVRTADSAKVESLSILDKVMVFSIRHRASREEILSFDGRALLIYAIERGMVGKNSVAANTIGDVEVNNAFAKGQLIANGDPAPFYFHFYKEEGQWKIDLTALFPVSTTAFQRMADESGKDENEFLFSILEILTGDKPSGQIWQPVE